ncbi:hypothetical protein QBC46DRAFT_20305 [Diplogelasinospora grovesii]|uniref:Uncharacterized protein n=1 Tax=Diplogelasinospora grovesii TaxID=303347 RepID=A0AAN6N1L4_9PEZI|nr:hypothetical protein QBC46DRAFT_20305 [Diplogelasinospora grovesii]
MQGPYISQPPPPPPFNYAGFPIHQPDHQQQQPIFADFADFNSHDFPPLHPAKAPVTHNPNAPPLPLDLGLNDFGHTIPLDLDLSDVGLVGIMQFNEELVATRQMVKELRNQLQQAARERDDARLQVSALNNDLYAARQVEKRLRIERDEARSQVSFLQKEKTTTKQTEQRLRRERNEARLALIMAKREKQRGKERAVSSGAPAPIATAPATTSAPAPPLSAGARPLSLEDFGFLEDFDNKSATGSPESAGF